MAVEGQPLLELPEGPSEDIPEAAANAAPGNEDLLEAEKQEEQLEELMQEVVTAQEKLESAAHQTLAFQRDLALATDRSLVLRAEEQEHSGTVEKEQLIVAAHAHLRQCLCRDPAGKLWPVWSTKVADLQEYGPGISLYFGFTVRLGITFFLCSILVLPLLLLSLVGNGLDNIDAGTGELGVLAWSTLGNLQKNGTINSGPFNIPAADFSYWAGLLDAVAMGATWAVAFWFCQKTIPDAVARERKEVVTPDAYTLYISGLPRRLEQHLQYEQLLQAHFERMLNAELTPGIAATGVEVINRAEQFMSEPPARSCSWQRDLDSCGRRIGVISDGCKDQVSCEAADCAPPEGERNTVHKVSLVRDFNGRLGRYRAAVESAQRSHQQKKQQRGSRRTSELDEAEKGKILQELEEVKVEELEVLGAFVTFTHVKHKEFISQEYRFSRIMLLGRWLQGDDQRFEGDAIRASDAPLPADIFWENIDCPKNKRRLKKVVIAAAFLVLVLVMILCLSLAKWGREEAQAQGSGVCPAAADATESQKLYCSCTAIGIQNVLRDIPAGTRQECSSWLETYAYSQAMMILAVAFSSVINIAAGVLISLIAHFAQPPNFTVLESRIMQMTFVVKVLTLGVVVTLVNADFQFYIGSFKGLLGLLGAGQFKDIDKAWNAAVGVEILTLIVFSIMNEIIAIAFVLLFKLKCYCLAGRKVDWRSMKELFTPPQFELANYHADQLSLVFACLLFSSCLPAVLIVLAVRLFSMRLRCLIEYMSWPQSRGIEERRMDISRRGRVRGAGIRHLWDRIFPYGPSLTSAARDLFAFQSAAEELPVPSGAAEAEADLTDKVQNIEAAVLGLQGGLEAIRQQLARSGEGEAAQKGIPPRPGGGGRAKPEKRVEGLDPTVLAAARAAGVPQAQLERMGELARQGGKLGDGARAAASPLSESEEEDDAGKEMEAQPENVSEAICKITEILGQLAKSRRGGTLEELLERGETADPTSSSTSGGSSRGAAYAKLVSLLKEDPEKISRSVLKLMAEDYGAHKTAPGLDGVQMTAHSWLEHRSRVQQYAGPWAVVETLSRGVTAWNAHPLIGPEAMGRNAAKVESCEEILSALEAGCERAAEPTARTSFSEATGKLLSAKVCGTLNLEPASLAQSVVPERLRFFERPSFDPVPFMSEGSRAVYRRPLDFARNIPDEEPVPRTQVRCSRDAALRLLSVLDKCGRLELRPARKIRERVLNGMFAIPKDLERD
eukprot:s5630_g5.t2